MPNPFLQALGKEETAVIPSGTNPFLTAVKPTIAEPIEIPKQNWWDIVKGIPKAAVKLYKPLVEKVLPLFTGPTKHLLEKGEEFVETVVEPSPMAEKVAAGLSLTTAGVGTLFTPITAVFEAAEKVPVLKQAAELIAAPFVVGGVTGSFIADRFVDVLPISKENKDILRPAFEEVGELTGMIWLGGKAMKEIMENKPITKEKVTELTKEANVIKETVKEMEIAPKPAVKPEIRVEPIKPPKAPEIAVEVAKPPIPEPVVGVKPTKVALSMETKAIEAGMTEGFKDLAGYEPIKIKEQAKMMSDIMKTDIEMAKRIALGEEPLPKGLKGATAVKAIEDYAMEIKDGELVRKLAMSPLVAETSVAGQTLRLTAERVPDSAVIKAREVVKVREETVEKRLRGKKPSAVKADLKKGLDTKIKKSKPSKYDWNNFIEKIVC